MDSASGHDWAVDNQPPVHVVASAGRTRIGSARIAAAGHRAELVMVHGSITTHEQWLPFAREVAVHGLSGVLVERRGRGISPDGPGSAYTLEIEAEDLAAVVADLDPHPILLGHSFGGLVALTAVANGLFRPRMLILYEPALPIPGPLAGDQLAPFVDLLESGDDEAALVHGLTHFVRLSATEIRIFRRGPWWRTCLEVIDTWPRELAAVDSARFTDLGGIDIPTRVLVGMASPAHLVAASEHLPTVLSKAHLHHLGIPGHFAHVLKPRRLAEVVAELIG